MAYSVDELIRALFELKEEGYSYCELSIDEDTDEKGISFSALDTGGLGLIDFETVVEAVPNEEIQEYANANEQPAEIRNPITLERKVIEIVSEVQEIRTGTKSCYCNITTYYDDENNKIAFDGTIDLSKNTKTNRRIQYLSRKVGVPPVAYFFNRTGLRNTSAEKDEMYQKIKEEYGVDLF